MKEVYVLSGYSSIDWEETHTWTVGVFEIGVQAVDYKELLESKLKPHLNKNRYYLADNKEEIIENMKEFDKNIEIKDTLPIYFIESVKFYPKVIKKKKIIKKIEKYGQNLYNLKVKNINKLKQKKG